MVRRPDAVSRSTSRSMSQGGRTDTASESQRFIRMQLFNRSGPVRHCAESAASFGPGTRATSHFRSGGRSGVSHPSLFGRCAHRSENRGPSGPAPRKCETLYCWGVIGGSITWARLRFHRCGGPRVACCSRERKFSGGSSVAMVQSMYSETLSKHRKCRYRLGRQMVSLAAYAVNATFASFRRGLI